MFYGRRKELDRLHSEFSSVNKSAVLVYGKRRIGKSTLIREAAEDFDGLVISHLCIQSSYEGNLDLLSRSVCDSLGLPRIRFDRLEDVFAFLGQQNRPILLILDEYQYLKESGRRNEVDSAMQGVIDRLPPQLKLVLCGSYISIMKELLEEDDPLFGRFTCVIHLEEFDYSDAALFYPQAEVNRKIADYAIFGGSPYVLTNLDGRSLKDNIVRLLLPETGILRIYVESVLLREMQKAFDVRIIEALGNGRKKYSEINDWIGGKDNGFLDKQLKNLLSMEVIRRTAPINRPNDRKKQFYEINDNLVRFYFCYIFGRTGLISRLGEEVYYTQYITPSITEFISRRFESIACQYFSRMVKAGKRRDVLDIGPYWYDDARSHTNGEFDCVLKVPDGYDFYECKYYEKPMTLAECRKEETQVRAIPGISAGKVDFICSAGFVEDKDPEGEYDLIDGEMLYQ